jgi:hypothetical protein
MAMSNTAYNKAYHEAHREERRAYQKIWYMAHREERLAVQKAYQKTHKKEIAAYQRKRLASDPGYRLSHALRTRLTRAIKSCFKDGSAVRDIGCSIPELKSYIEARFRPGMTWENHGEWHIDHIVPLSRFDLSDRKQLLVACHYTNLQPLWAADNLSKGAG